MSQDQRSQAFSRNEALEALLKELSDLLGPANHRVCEGAIENTGKIFVAGALRSGTTLFTQWLASTGAVSWPTNLLSRFYGAPAIGAKIQQLLTDQKFNFRDEILDFDTPPEFVSENGKTKGALSPNEFWYFWRRFLPYEDLDYLPDEELKARADLKGLRDELNTLANIFGKPFVAKAMILNQNLAILDSLFTHTCTIWIKREPAFNIQSALLARERQTGSMHNWYSFKIREYPDLVGLDPLQSVAGQIAANNVAIEKQLAALPESRKMIVPYEAFCQKPSAVYHALRSASVLPAADETYSGVESFEVSNDWKLKKYSVSQAADAYAKAEAYYKKKYKSGS